MNTYASNTRIINGTAASISDYPWVVSMIVSDGQCGGSLIHPEWVLSAAHCFLNSEGNAVDLSSGANTTVTINSTNINDLDDNGIQIQGESVIVHPQYNPNEETSANSEDNDIALLKLSEPATGFTTISIIDGRSTDLTAGTVATILGWGATNVDANGEATGDTATLLKVDQKVVSNSECATNYSGHKDITDNMICANGFDANDTRDSCKGDSGGPLVINNNGSYLQVGLSSFGGTDALACGDPKIPGVYTKLSRYKSFIEQYISGVSFVAQGDTPSTTDNNNSSDNSDSSNSNSCGGAQLDADLNISIPCLIYQGDAYQTGLNLISELYWQWSGDLSPSTCISNTESCSTVGDDFSLTIKRVTIGEQEYTATLEYDGENSGEDLFWSYSSHE